MNLLEEYGYSAAQIDERIEQTWKTLFEGNKAQRIYFEAADETGYIYETLFDDVRTESMGFGMMMCVQMDKQQIFDRLWKWTRTYMYISEGELKGYFRFACHTDGTEKYKNPRPDGEETIARNLINFFDKKQVADFMDYKIDGTPRRRHSRHPVALCSAIAQAAIVLERRRTPIENEMREKARAAVERFWNTPLRNGKHRYYDNTQYLLSLLILSGKYMVY